MYIEAVPNRNSPPAVLLRESYRSEDGKVKKRTIANLSALDPQIIAGLKVLLKGGSASEQALEEQFEVERTLAHGHVAAALGQFRKLGMFALLARGRSEERSICAALIVSRLLDPGSKLSLSRQLSRESATNTLAEELGLNERVSEKDLYSAMSWLLSRQERIERTLAKQYLGSSGKPVLYDLTSTYYEGSTCVLAQRGYSRDGKKGTRQINFGMLCSGEGCPVAVEVFTGNTADPSTVEAQVDKLRERFGMEKILLVGDRGMLTSARIEALRESDTISWISALQSSGVRGLVMDTCCRDMWALNDLEFPVFGIGCTPADSKGRIDVTELRQPVTIDGVTIEPGDFGVGDLDGVVVIPRDAAQEAVSHALEKVSGENTVREELRAGVPVAEVFRKHGIL